MNHLKIRSILYEISHEFVGGTIRKIEEKLHSVLDRCGQFVRCDRAYIALLAQMTNRSAMSRNGWGKAPSRI